MGKAVALFMALATLVHILKPLGLPAMPWVMVVGLAAVLGWWIKGWRLALLAGGCIFYIAIIVKWKLSMTTSSETPVPPGAFGAG